MITFYIQFFIFLDILLISEEKRNFIKKLNDWFLKIIFNLRLKKGRIFFVVTIKVCFFFSVNMTYEERIKYGGITHSVSGKKYL